MKPFRHRKKGKEVRWKFARRQPFTANLPLGGSHNFHAGLDVAAGRSSDLQAWPIKVTGFSTGPSSRFQRKPVLIGCSILLTAAGQSRFRTGFSLDAPLGASPANEPQDRGSLIRCQSDRKTLSASDSNFYWYNDGITKWLYSLYQSGRTIALNSKVGVAISNGHPLPVSAHGMPRRVM